MDTVLGIIAVILLVMMNGFFVAAEFSLVSARRTRIEQLAQEGNKAAQVAQKAIEHLDSYIAATQLGITLASLALGWIGEPAVGHLFESFLPEELAHTVGKGITVTLAFSLVTIVHIVLGELVPKSIALQRPEATALFVVRPTRWFRAIFHPVITLMNNVGNGIVRLLGFNPANGHSNVHSPEELEMLVQSSREAGLLQPSEEQLLRRVFDFSDVEIREVMRPRTEVDALAIDTPLPELLNRISSLHYSRYPLYQGTVDTVTGILHTKDLLDAIGKQPELLANGQSFDLRSIMRTPLFVPQTTGVDRVLDQMQRSKTQMAIVIDEYGGMAGVATMEDIIEELVGEVNDEFDVEEPGKVETPTDAMLVDGLMTMSDAIERFGEPGVKVMSTTIGGYIAERLDRIPVKGDVVAFSDHDVRVEAMDGMRVAQVRFIKRMPEQVPDKQAE